MAALWCGSIANLAPQRSGAGRHASQAGSNLATHDGSFNTFELMEKFEPEAVMPTRDHKAREVMHLLRNLSTRRIFCERFLKTTC